MKNSSNLNISCKVVFSLNKWNKKVGSPSSFGRKRPFISLNSSASIGNLSSSERTRARARANHAKNDAQKGCAMQLNGITLRGVKSRQLGRRCNISNPSPSRSCGNPFALPASSLSIEISLWCTVRSSSSNWSLIF